MDCTIYKDTFIARQPVFDTSMSAWGYLLLHRHGPDDSWMSFESAFSSSTDVLACLPFLSGCIPPSLQTMLHFPIQSIRDSFPCALNPLSTTMIISGAHELDSNDLALLKEHLHRGFTLALDTSPTEIPSEALLDMASILICDTLESSYDHTTELVALGKENGLKLLAKNIASSKRFQAAQAHGFDLFHGSFFVQPKTNSVRTAPSTTVTKLKLFDILMPDEPDFDALTHAIEPDVAITHRLIAFLNSAHFSFTQEISSVRQAVVLAGWDPIRNWLRILLLTDMLPNKKNKELSYQCAHRAKFLELLAMRSKHAALADSLFLTGLFSLLDTMLDLPMEEILSHLHLSKNISTCLLGNESPLSPWLDLTRVIERGEWDNLGHIAMALSLPPGAVAESYRLAFQWADEFFAMPEQLG